MENEDALYAAMLARDYRFDGKFFVGVRTTGIYCRPICPARPKRNNVEFFPSGHAAEKAGYRPCLRCRPEAAPNSAAWIGTSALVQRALKLIRDKEALASDENAFAERFGVSARHLRRVFREEIGKTPKRIAYENRLNLSRKLIVETALPMAEVGFAAGFASVRRFNHAFRERFKKPPSEIRRAKRPADLPMVLSLPYRPPFDFGGLLAFYARHAIAGLESFPPGRYERVVSQDGKLGRLGVSDDPAGHRLLLEYDFPDTAAIGSILNRVRRMFDLDSDPLLVANAMRGDKVFSGLLAKRPGARLPTGWDPFETAIATILGQLVSVGRGRVLVDDLVRLQGSDAGIGLDGKPIRLFPAPSVLARADLKGLGTTGMRKRTLAAFSEEVASGRLSLDPAQSVEGFHEKLLAIPGIGRWTADYMALRVLGHADAFPATDLILARAIKAHSPEAIAKLSPWRGYAAILLWGGQSHTLTKEKGAKP
ncbi:MAG: methylation and regulatory protein Ada [Fibrobacteres bacterium]|nr:methylation and regulatory protein Ada [Fibrobacterota bacterium]